MKNNREEEDSVDRLSCLGVITPLGERKEKTTPGFLSANKLICPKCGRMDYGNIDQSRMVMCGLYFMNGAMIAGNREREQGVPLAKRVRPIARQRKPQRKCERCGELFRGRSNSQRFCDTCQRWAKNDRNRGNMARYRENGKESVVVE